LDGYHSLIIIVIIVCVCVCERERERERERGRAEAVAQWTALISQSGVRVFESLPAGNGNV
jgi:hypothetical protein